MGFDFTGCFGDKRSETRAALLAQGLYQANSCVIQQAIVDRAGQRGAYYLLSNVAVSEAALIRRLGSQCAAQARGKTVLCIHDTTEINLSRHRGRIRDHDSGLGSLDHGQGLGFKLHLSLVVDASDCQVLGIPAARLYTRDPNTLNKHQRRYQRQSIDQKESARWEEQAIEATQVIDEAACIISVEDREGDIFSQFLKVAGYNAGRSPQQPRSELLVRSMHNRSTVEGEGTRIYALLGDAPVLGQLKVQVAATAPGRGKERRPKREATLSVRAIRTRIRAPLEDRASRGADVEVSVVEAVELDPPPGVPALRWALITTLEAAGFEQAATVVRWYSWRWTVERFFGVVKGECYDVEGSELECGWAIRKLTLLIMELSVKVMQMQQGWRSQDTQAVADLVFSEAEQASLSRIGPKLEGSTALQRNAYQKGTLLWATWIIARLGGWKGYAKSHRPGAQTLLLGMERFYQRHAVYQEDKDVGTQ